MLPLKLHQLRVGVVVTLQKKPIINHIHHNNKSITDQVTGLQYRARAFSARTPADSP